MLGRETIVRDEQRQPALDRQRSRKMPMGARRTNHVPPAVQIEERRVVAAATRPHPLAFDTSDDCWLRLETIRRSRHQVPETVEKRPLLLDRLPLHITRRGEELRERRAILDCHCGSPKSEPT